MNEKSTPSLIFSVFAEKAVKIKNAPAGKGRGAREISESGKVVGTHGGVFVGNLLFRRNYAGAKPQDLTLINLDINAILDPIIISGDKRPWQGIKLAIRNVIVKLFLQLPLRIAINYVDLLKQENIQNEKAKEYIEVLDNKSQRLKKLIEDLVEASKASSGNIKINKEVLNVKELLNQVTGEFEDKFNSRGLNIISKLPEKTVYIKADSRYLYRVLENIYSNVAKYAEENTRVYIDCILEEENTVTIYVKNISKDELNISADELMQRFVRGDKSRNTEGSGLGLSIAKSLTELQDGTFNIYLDGDLFKVAIKFKRV